MRHLPAMLPPRPFRGLTRCAVATAALFLNACVPGSSAPPAPEREVRVLVYNIHAGKDAAGRDNLERVARLIDSLDADVALLQEVDRNTERSGRIDQPATLARLTGLNAAFGKTLDFQGGEYGIAILSRWPIESDSLIRLPVEPKQERSGGSYEPRGALRADVAAPGAPFVVINTHLDPSTEDTYRRQEARTVLSTVAALDSARTSTLVGGDFNSTPDSPLQQTIRAAGVRDVWLMCGRGNGLTFPADSAVRRIDYLYLSGPTACSEARVVPSDASDHRALFVRVMVRER